jgi:filamentous hemagglutinin family protein
MKPKRFFFRSPPLFGAALRYGTPVCLGFSVLISNPAADAREMFGTGMTRSATTATATTGGATPATTDLARANAQAMLARTNQTLVAMRAMQTAARNAAVLGANHLGTPAAHLPDVPNGLTSGGLQVATLVADPLNPGKFTNWKGANAPVQTVSGTATTVTIKQTSQQALLNWQTFNVGKQTTVTFDQSAGGQNASQWIAFNKISDPTGNPTQILGSIKAAGQVYLINQNGVIFGGSSQVNTRNLTVSALPINDNLIQQGLLNNRDAQFLFSGLFVPGGADGTKDFTPEAPPASGRYGDVTVEAGAELTSTVEGGGNGGRVTLIGANVTNAGTISTASGQTVLAAGLQVAVAAHDGNDPSLRGLDVWVGAVADPAHSLLGNYAGTVNQTGLVETLTGSTTIAGRAINQLGVINSSTSVNLNGRIDLKASYGAVANPNFDNPGRVGEGGPMFFNQFTGVVTLGTNSVTQILPDYASSAAVPGAALPERSQVNIEGLAIHFDKNSILFAPNAEVAVRAGVWPYKDTDGNRTVLDANGNADPGLTSMFQGAKQTFQLDGGQIYVDEAASISVAGSADVFVPLSQNILTVELRGAELADSPLQRNSDLRGVPLTVDIRDTGTFNGKFWVGTPLGDVTGLAGLIARNAAQLTTAGGNITLQAGGSIVARNGSSLDVSGGFYRHEGGQVNTTMLLSNGRLVAIKNATPDQVYDGVYTGKSVISQKTQGNKITTTYATSMKTTGTYQASYVEGASGGTLSITAPSMALDGNLRGLTVEGPRQRSSPAAGSVLKINFSAQKAFTIPGGAIKYLNYSPTPPAVTFATQAGGGTVPEFALVNSIPAALPAERVASVVLGTGLLGEKGFGSLDVANPDGSISVPETVTLAASPKGAVSLAAANLTIQGSVIAPGGKLSFTTYDISPTAAAEYVLVNPPGVAPYPLAVAGRGMFVLGSAATLSTAGLITDDRAQSVAPAGGMIVNNGGDISINSYSASFATGSVIDVSGGAYLADNVATAYGKGGNISIATGTDPGFAGVLGGTLTLDSTLRAYSGTTGGSLAIQASLIEVGGSASAGTLHLTEDFFRKGGFTKYALTGVGAGSTAVPPAGQFQSYIPAISIAAGTQIRPLAESMMVVGDSARGGAIGLERYVQAEGLRPSVSLSFTALGSDDPFTISQLEVRGDVVMDRGASIVTGPGASVSFKGGTVTLLGSVTTPGGKISVAGASAFPFTATQRQTVSQALPTVHLGAATSLSVAGNMVLTPDALGRRIGTVYAGGAISVAGNIVAEKGSSMNASGASGILDLDPASLANSTGAVRTSANGRIDRSVATRVDSNGGVIDLSGSQMLLSDATLRGGAGGATATGGQLIVSSGRYYAEGATRTSADINLVVSQSGDVITNPGATMGVGIGLVDGTGAAYGNFGSFALDRFSEGSFASLSLGGKYFASATPIPYGGNVEFHGKIDLAVSGTLRLAAGGVIRADDTVKLSASYLNVGQAFLAPQNPADPAIVPFLQDPANPGNAFTFAPTYGSGTLAFDAKLIDVGTLSLQNIGRADLTAKGGDIRGNGTLSMAGDLTLEAAQIYPTSLASFSIFAYDHAGGSGSVTLRASGDSKTPLSAGGNLGIYATSIVQGGVLRAPLGTIRLGWDGSDLNPGTSAIDKPYNPIAGLTIDAPITRDLTLESGSETAVGAPAGWIAPYGLSPDGKTWVDPRGVTVTLSGMPEKAVFITGQKVNMKAGAVVDISGGGDLFASRWVPGNGGSVDLLGSATAVWGAGTKYQAGDLVTYNGTTWSARVSQSGQTPGSGLYWSKVADSYAIVPSSSLAFAPYNPFNTGTNATSLAGDPGYVSAGLSVGDTITLDAGSGVAAGTYTLLPRGYALLPGAFLVTPLSGTGTGAVVAADGSVQVSGYTGNRFNQPETPTTQRVRFEIASAAVVKNRVTYNIYSANNFLGTIAKTLKTSHPQQLPNDGGYALLHGNSALSLDGILRTQAPGLGAKVDVSSFSDILLTDGTGVGGVVLQTSVLASWKASSLLIGGVRRQDSTGTSVVDVRTSHLTLDNVGGDLSASDVVLVSQNALTITAGSALSAWHDTTYAADAMSVTGDGTLVRVSADAGASTTRSGVTGSVVPLMTIGSGAKLGGVSVMLDSTFGTELAADAVLGADHLTLGSGQISVVFDGASGVTSGSVVDPHLVLTGGTLQSVLNSQDLTLRSYRSIDLYGNGTLSSASLKSLTLVGSGLRGYEQAGGAAGIRAAVVTFENSIQAAGLAAPAVTSGSLQVDAGTIRLGAGAFAVSGYQDLVLNASSGIIAQGVGSFATAGDLHANTPLITGDSGASHSITAAQAMVLNRIGVTATAPTALGAILTLQAATILANSDILLPSGQLTLRASAGNVEVGGKLSVAGSSKAFNDLTRYADAGAITLESQTGDVVLTNTSEVSVAAASGGGNSGTLNINAAQGTFSSSAKLDGQASAGFSTGSCALDIAALSASGSGSLATINTLLDAGGFTDSRVFRIRSGDVMIGSTIHSHSFTLSADLGSITVTGAVDASGTTGGAISLAAHGDLTVASGALLSVAADKFDSAGKGGSILLEAGTQRDGAANTSAMLNLQSGATLDLSVKEYVAGTYTQLGSSAFYGKFTGTLHLRAPRTASNDDLQIGSIDSTILGASSVIAEGFTVYQPVGGVMDTWLRDQINAESTTFLGTAGVGNANEVAMRGRLLTGAADATALGKLLVIAPGVEIINPTGDLTLGLANNTSSGSTDPQALATADWDLSSFRYGTRNAPGILTLRANGNLIFNNTLSDGFTPIAQSSDPQENAANGNSLMWLATLTPVATSLPTNTQSWSFRLTAGADTNASNFGSVLTTRQLDLAQPGGGSVIVGEFYPAVPNNTADDSLASGIGTLGLTANSIRISTTADDLGTRFEVVRTGTGDIAIHAGRDVQLCNQFATIYTAGVALPKPTTVFTTNDFALPVLNVRSIAQPPTTGGGVDLGSAQQIYQPSWAMAGGNVTIAAQANIGHYTLVDGVLTVDASRQTPTNWLYRRGYVNANTGLFANDGGIAVDPLLPAFPGNINDKATSTTWWIDYSNFFEGVGALGGGNVTLKAGHDIVNVDAVAPTNARMPGRIANPDYGVVAGAAQYLNVAPDAAKLLELGGGDVSVTAGRNIDGGVYYVERGQGMLFAGGSITTNEARSPSLGILDGSKALDPLTWLPTTLFVGKSSFDVSAFGDVLLGPVSNPFLLPQGNNNKYWYKTYFNTYAADAGLSVASYGGSVTFRNEINPGGASAGSILGAWFSRQDLFNGDASANNASYFQPWLRLAEADLGNFGSMFSLAPPNLRGTSFAGAVNLVGSVTLFPSATGTLELAAGTDIVGLQKTGSGTITVNKTPTQVQVWTASTVNVSDASPASIPGIATPLAYQSESTIGRDPKQAIQSNVDVLQAVHLALGETGSSSGVAGTSEVKQALHATGLLHTGDLNPVRLYALGGDITGLTLFSPKQTQIVAKRDITDIAFYLQNISATDVSLVSAGRDIIPFNENADVRAMANNIALGNIVGGTAVRTVAGNSTNALAGDIQINGPGVMEVLGGRNIDLGTGANFIDGTGVGITSIGNTRNPNLPFDGADLIAMAGLSAVGGNGPAFGLAQSTMDMAAFISQAIKSEADVADSAYLKKLRKAGWTGTFAGLTKEQQAIVGMEKFYATLREAGSTGGKTGNYDVGYAAVKALFGDTKPAGEIFTRAREIRTSSGGSISLGVSGGGITMASDIFGNPLTPPGIVTEFGGSISTFTDGNVDIGQARIFTLRGGDIVMWSSNGNIAAGSAPRTVVTAPPTRVVLDVTSASVQTDLGGLATGGGIGVLAAVEGVKAGNVGIYAPKGYVDAGDAGIRSTGNTDIGARQVLNAANISSAGTTSGASVSAPAAPSVSTVTSASNANAASSSTAVKPGDAQKAADAAKVDETPSLITVEVIGYGGDSGEEEDKDKDTKEEAAP